MSRSYIDKDIPSRKPTEEEMKERLREAAERSTVNVIGIDPGDKHVGVACWTAARGMKSVEVDAAKALPFIDELLRAEARTALVVERFVLYPGKAQAQSWSPMATAEMIGALKWIAATHAVPVVLQGADIKKPIRGQCRARQLEHEVSSVHASDARLHLWYFLLRNEIVE